MFKNAGRKIKGIAKTVFWLIVICVIIGALSLLGLGAYVEEGEYMAGFVLGAVFMLVFGILYAWLGTIMLYGYGELIDSNQRIANSVEKNNSL